MGKRLIVSILNIAMVITISLVAGTTGANAKIADEVYSASNSGNLAIYAESSAASQTSQSGPSTSTDWPMLSHNPQRTNYSASENIISASNVNSLQPLWQQSIDTDGRNPSSNPVTYQGRVYVGSSSVSGPNFFVFNAATGAPLWQADLGHGAQDCFNVGIGSTAAIQNNVVSIGGGDPKYFGLKADTGSVRWEHSIVGPDGGLGYFAWVSPLIYIPADGTSTTGYTYVGVASSCDNPQVAGQLRSLNLYTGKVEAKLSTVPPGYLGGTVWTPPALSLDGTKVVLTTGEDMGWQGAYVRSIVVVDPITLQVIGWNQQGDPGEDADWGTGPTIFNAGATSTVQLVGALQKDYDAAGNSGWYHAYNLGNVSQGPIWSREVGHHVGPNAAYDPTVHGGTLFVPKTYADDSRIYALDPATGVNKPQYSTNPLILPPWTIWGQIVLANGLLFINDHGSVKIYNASNFQLLRTLTPSGATGNYTGVTVSGGIVYWVSGDNLNAWALSSTP